MAHPQRECRSSMFSHNLFYTSILCNILHNNLENKYFSKIKNYSGKSWKQQAGKSGKLSENLPLPQLWSSQVLTKESHSSSHLSKLSKVLLQILLQFSRTLLLVMLLFKRHLNESECRFINEK